MDEMDELRVVEVDVIAGAAMVYFNDDTCGLYSASLLQELFFRAEKIDQSEPPE
jgi:hypothetical protein